MPFNFYAEKSFIEMCGRGYFGVRICPRMQKHRTRRHSWTVVIQSY